MDLSSATTIKNILSRYKTRPSKGLGQNFLIDKKILNKIIDASDIKITDIVLEIGPGVGTLTQALASKAGEVIAIEKDKKMIDILTNFLNASNIQNVKIVSEDILKLDPKSYALNPYKIVANIPYYLTSPLIRKFLEDVNQPKEMILMLQKEVAKRICSKPPDMSLLAVSVQFYANAKIISYVSKNCFWPAPKVDSAIIKITPNKKYDVPSDSFFEVVKAGFSQPRKQILGNLSKILKLEKIKIEKWLASNNIKLNQRAETLSVDDWVKLTNSYLLIT